jgi:anthranilate synthase component 1
MSFRFLDGLRPFYKRLRGSPSALGLYSRLYAGERHGFLYESLEERGGCGRFSFLGGRPLATFRSKGERIVIDHRNGRQSFSGNPLQVLRELVLCGVEALPVATFPGGAVGYMGYDIVRSVAPVPDGNPEQPRLPDAFFLVPEEILIVDHLDEVVQVLIYGTNDQGVRLAEIESVVRACEAMETPFHSPRGRRTGGPPAPIRSNMTAHEFDSAVRRAKEYIREGEVYQVVLSQRFEFEATMPPLELYAALRVTNPSPYMYYLNLDGLHLSGSSPEILVKLTGRHVVTRPLAGTRPRGSTPHEDTALGRELLADPKERAEHVMLVDLARNDIGRVCRTGSVSVDEFLEIERYSRVMHLVSNVTGKLRDDRDAVDLFEASFPAGTVSGAPKVRAMQIIDELEPVRRGPYAGAIGYFSFLGDMDLCIAIRTLLLYRGRGYLQAGAGIVADSDPRREYEETLNKARGTLGAVSRSGGSALRSEVRASVRAPRRASR